jgi:glycosyltransferase involved in cell wall biosynthesis
VVVPVHYEHEVIAETLERLESTLTSDTEILVVYDLEEDPTTGVVRQGAERWPRARLVRNSVGRGVLGAIKTGLDESKGDLVLVFMADLSDEPEVIPAMLELAADGCDVVCGSRYMSGGDQIGAPRLKAFLSSTAGRSLHLLTGLPVHDATNSFRLYSRDLLRSVRIESTGGFEVGLELTVKAYLQRRRLGEVPTTWRERASGESKFNFRKWLPSYLRWYLYLLVRAPFGIRLRTLPRVVAESRAQG